MENTRLNLFLKIHKSMTDFKSYKLFISQSVGKAIAYLLLVSLLFGGLLSLFHIYQYNKEVTNLVNIFNQDFPDFELKNGLLLIDEQMPITIEEQGSIFIIDTSGKTDESILEKYNNIVIVFKDKVILKNNGMERVFRFNDYRDFYFTKSDMNGLFSIIRVFATIIPIFLDPIVLIVKMFICAFILSVAGLIANTIIRANFSFKKIFILSIYSLTLPVLVGTIIDISTIITGTKIDFFWGIFLGLGIFYLVYSMSSIKKDMDSTQTLV